MTSFSLFFLSFPINIKLDVICIRRKNRNAQLELESVVRVVCWYTKKKTLTFLKILFKLNYFNSHSYVCVIALIINIVIVFQKKILFFSQRLALFSLFEFVCFYFCSYYYLILLIIMNAWPKIVNKNNIKV